MKWGNSMVPNWLPLEKICEEYNLDFGVTETLIMDTLDEEKDYVFDSEGHIFVAPSAAQSLLTPQEEDYTISEIAKELGVRCKEITDKIQEFQQSGVFFPGISEKYSPTQRRKVKYYSRDFLNTYKELAEEVALDEAIMEGPILVSGDAEPVFEGLSQKAREAYIALAAGKPISKSSLADTLDIAPGRITPIITELVSFGYDVLLDECTALLSKKPRIIPGYIDVPWMQSKTHCRFGVVSDAHIGNKSCKLHSLQEAYRTMKSEGCEFVFNCGDLVDGSVSMHKGMQFELKLPSLSQQLTFAMHYYPRDLPTVFIDGNHDLSWHKHVGLKPCQHLCESAKDEGLWFYAGAGEGWVTGPNGDPHFFLLSHPDGGASKDLSGRSRRVNEALFYRAVDVFNEDHESVSAKMPKIQLMGHIHKFNVSSGPNNSYLISVPASCDLTQFQTTGSLVNIMGALIVDFSISDSGYITDLNVRHLPYKPGDELDYAALMPDEPEYSIDLFKRSQNG